MVSASTPIYAWSPGQDPFTFPSTLHSSSTNILASVSYNIGGLTGNNFGILQILYHNPGGAIGTDNSGTCFRSVR